MASAEIQLLDGEIHNNLQQPVCVAEAAFRAGWKQLEA